MATMLSRRISLLGNELSQQCHIAMHMDKDRQRMQPNSGSSSTVEENGCTLELPGVCVGGGGGGGDGRDGRRFVCERAM